MLHFLCRLSIAHHMVIFVMSRYNMKSDYREFDNVIGVIQGGLLSD